MKIILVQAEINQALTDYVTSQIRIQEGMRVTVDLAATRGEEGYTATVSIVSDGTKKTKQTESVYVPEPIPEPVKQPEPVIDAVLEPTPEPKKEEPVEVPEQPKPVGTRSLFANLTRPNNNLPAALM